MGKYIVKISAIAKKHLADIHKSGNKSLIKKVEIIFVELSEHPYTGTGRPEQLKYLENTWSRRLNRKDRLVYYIDESVVTVTVISTIGHYDDK